MIYLNRATDIEIESIIEGYITIRIKGAVHTNGGWFSFAREAWNNNFNNATIVSTTNNNTITRIKVKGRLNPTGAVVTEGEWLSFATESGISNNFNHSTLFSTNGGVRTVQSLSFNGKTFWQKT